MVAIISNLLITAEYSGMYDFNFRQLLFNQQFEISVLLFCLHAGIPQTTLLAIEVAAPAGGLLLLIICVMCCVIAGLCVRQSRLKYTRDNYNFQRLSIAAQDYDEAEDDEDVREK